LATERLDNANKAAFCARPKSRRPLAASPDLLGTASRRIPAAEYVERKYGLSARLSDQPLIGRRVIDDPQPCEDPVAGVAAGYPP
jgi:hypothetical protein